MGRLTLVLVLLAASPSSAATLDVCSTCTYTTISSAIAAAAPGDTIMVAAGSYSGSFTVDRAVSIVGAGSMLVTATGTGASVVTISAAGVTISGMRIDPGSTVTRAIRATANATLSDIRVANEAGNTQLGTAISVEGTAVVTLTDSAIVDVSSSNRVIWLAASGRLDIVRTTLDHARWIEATNTSTLTLTDLTITRSMTLNALDSSNVTLTNVRWSTSPGSLVGSDTARVSIVDSTFDGAGAGSPARLVVQRISAAVSIIGTSFACPSNTGAIQRSGSGDLSIDGGSFVGCGSFTNDGGAILSMGGGRIVVRGTRFERNNGMDGGALFSSGSDGTVELEAVDFVDNGGYGAAIHSSHLGTGGVTCTRCLFERNNMASGRYDPTVDMVNGRHRFIDCRFEGNRTDMGTGAFRTFASTSVEIRGGRFCNHAFGDATELGGPSAAITISNVLFGGNGRAIVGSATASMALDHLAILGNGAGIVTTDDVALTNSVIAYTTGTGVAAAAASSVRYNAFFMNATNATGVVLDGTNVTGDPRFFAYSTMSPCASDLRVRTPSPLIDAGTGALDPNGSRADIGVHGGALADPAWWTDADADGSPYVYDCDDANGTRYPGRAEACNGADDDCDGTIDEGVGAGGSCTVGVGACARTGTRICNPDGSAGCSVMPGTPGSELCGTGMDEDCDGTSDEGFADLGMACTNGVGSCARSGTRVCSSDRLSTVCNAVPGTSATELCGTGMDEDCDGTSDEGFPDLGTSCTNGVGSCARTGSRVCSSDRLSTVCNAIAGTPGVEQCGSGADEDCDGSTDEGFPDLGMSCSAGIGACARGGMRVCAGASTACDATPGSASAETCDGTDEDCDGTADDGSLCAGMTCLDAGTALARCGCVTSADCASGECVGGVCTTVAIDAGMPDAGMSDAGMSDAGMSDAGVLRDDAGMEPMFDAGTQNDAGNDAAIALEDAGTGDAGMVETMGGCGCRASRASTPAWLGLAVLCLLRRRRR